MRIEHYGLKALAEARELAKACKLLHLPPPPIVSWQADIFNQDGIQTEKHIGKSNSYVRNGLNFLFTHGCFPNSAIRANTFINGTIGYKNTAGNNSNTGAWYGFYTNATLLPGYGTTAESVDLYALASVFGSGSGENQLNMGTTLLNTTFDDATTKFLNEIARSFQNGYGSAQTINEMGIFINMKRVYSTTDDSMDSYRSNPVNSLYRSN